MRAGMTCIQRAHSTSASCGPERYLTERTRAILPHLRSVKQARQRVLHQRETSTYAQVPTLGCRGELIIG
jgi:hypothetical protein